ncbi:TetR/AcrR family transcriptional regulator [Streptomyces iconiensis]|uniref:TetR family transcriptional regulator n=1 Tax=Streptomyces iconiensis TaxID=1384038 RepID=A0ABT6ZZ56_9ACTN|nr:TetR/AcrR family transcriptional regulator [Streptomyces iconiensis]MDJ1134142.1 TetR family transcriptional regulator [Streptomyces iconiensis]
MAALTAADRGREVRHRLLRAGAELIAERGWSAVSTRALAERAEVGPGLVHYHFASLKALLAEAALGAVKGLVDELTGLLETAPTVQEALDGALGALDAYTGRDTTSLLFTETYLAASRDEALRRDLEVVLARIRDSVAGRLRRDGVVADPEETAAVLLAALDGLMLHRPVHPGLTSAGTAPVLRRLLSRTDSTGDAEGGS